MPSALRDMLLLGIYVLLSAVMAATGAALTALPATEAAVTDLGGALQFLGALLIISVPYFGASLAVDYVPKSSMRGYGKSAVYAAAGVWTAVQAWQADGFSPAAEAAGLDEAWMSMVWLLLAGLVFLAALRTPRVDNWVNGQADADETEVSA